MDVFSPAPAFRRPEHSAARHGKPHVLSSSSPSMSLSLASGSAAVLPDLPNEILFVLLASLPRLDKQSFRIVCRRLCRIADLSIKRHNMQPADLLELDNEGDKQYERLSVNFSTKQWYRSLPTKFPNLTELNFNDVHSDHGTYTFLTEVAPRLAVVTALKAGELPLIFTPRDMFFKVSAIAFPNLAALTMTAYPSLECFKEITALKSLTWLEVAWQEQLAPSWRDFVANRPAPCWRDFVADRSATDDHVRVLGRMKSLQTLRLGGLFNVQSAEATTHIAALKQLRSLELQRLAVSEQLLAALSSVTTLTELQLHECSLPRAVTTPSNARAPGPAPPPPPPALAGLTSLVTVQLRGVRIDSRSVEALAQLPALQSLVLQGSVDQPAPPAAAAAAPEAVVGGCPALVSLQMQLAPGAAWLLATLAMPALRSLQVLGVESRDVAAVFAAAGRLSVLERLHVALAYRPDPWQAQDLAPCLAELRANLGQLKQLSLVNCDGSLCLIDAPSQA